MPDPDSLGPCVLFLALLGVPALLYFVHTAADRAARRRIASLAPIVPSGARTGDDVRIDATLELHPSPLRPPLGKRACLSFECTARLGRSVVWSERAHVAELRASDLGGRVVARWHDDTRVLGILASFTEHRTIAREDVLSWLEARGIPPAASPFRRFQAFQSTFPNIPGLPVTLVGRVRRVRHDDDGSATVELDLEIVALRR